MTAAMRFWLQRGVDGFRLDAIDHLLKDPELRDDPPATRDFGLPLDESYARLDHVHSTNAPDIGTALQAIRDAVGEALLVGEVYLPSAQLGPYLDALDVVFAFEAMNAGPDAERLQATIIAAIAAGKLGWVLSNHDFDRFASRFGAGARAAALLFLSLPGPVFVFQGDELGTPNGPGVRPPLDRFDRDRFRHPMAWDGGPNGGFTTGRPWLPALDPSHRNVADQERQDGSTLNMFRRAIAVKRSLSGRPLEILESPPGTVVLRRGEHTVAVNLADAPARIERPPELVLEARPGDGEDATSIPPHGAWIARE
jgi:alpha-glucosidase